MRVLNALVILGIMFTGLNANSGYDCYLLEGGEMAEMTPGAYVTSLDHIEENERLLADLPRILRIPSKSSASFSKYQFVIKDVQIEGDESLYTWVILFGYSDLSGEVGEAINVSEGILCKLNADTEEPGPDLPLIDLEG